ncbi:ZIP family metal transporter [Bacillus sp. 03113]|uniref:ZIP family metal transporter n=1 Tax=Bacillus sp. 03113 TaxID=2578211 RepID=UPI0011421A8C|nr:ZIP family metal transporter [Bacillus sp. 03113]
MNAGLLLSAFCTVIGSIPALFLQNLSHKVKDNLLAYSAGIMVAASTYGLIPSTIKLSNWWVLTIGMLLGVSMLTFLESILPHHEADHKIPSIHQTNPQLLLIAMAIHNVPEGLSIGISYASQYKGLGQLVSFAIGLQNIPEGFLISLFLIATKISRMKTIMITLFTGMIELFASYVGLTFSEGIEFIIPYGLAFAAGAMLFVVYKEIIPESHGDGNERTATFSFIIGLLTMVALTEWIR